MEKYIVVIGGVISGVGKGVATASIGKILKEYGYSATAIKIDPYINYDAGTLRPTEHGEVWVTHDGGEIDQDLGNYERFLEIDIPKKNNITTGQIYKTVIDKERRGEYLGETVQFIPHIPDEIKRRIREAGAGFDIVLIEIGGTVGDYENIPFLFAIKGLERELGKANIVYVLITFLPVPIHIGEMKTKPTQQAIKMLQENGIIPDIILCRGKSPLDEVRRKKIELYANIKKDFVISAPDITTLYKVPLNFETESLGIKLLQKLSLKPKRQPNWVAWKGLVKNIESPKKHVSIGMIGKYVDIGDFSLRDSYISINEALEHAGAKLCVGVKITWVDSKSLEKSSNAVDNLAVFDGIVIPGGFGATGVAGKVRAIQFAREVGVPFLGLCYGMHCAVVDFARNVCGMKDAHTSEIDPKTSCPVVDILQSQKNIMAEHQYGGTMRLGAYAAYLKEKSLVYALYDREGRIETDMQEEIPPERMGIPIPEMKYVIERHRHRYEISPAYVSTLEEKGLVFSGLHTCLDGTKLMEFMELPGHPFFVATQAHPEFRSRFLTPAPLFLGFLEACCNRSNQSNTAH